MFGLSSLGIFHTAISLVALGAGAVLLIRDGRISLSTSTGRLYVATTVVTCLTALGIFRHGAITPGHVLSLITLATLVVAGAAGAGKLGKASRYVETVSYSATFFFHLVPGVTETATRLPPAAPLAASPDAPGLQVALGAIFVLFLGGAVMQVLAERRRVAESGN